MVVVVVTDWSPSFEVLVGECEEEVTSEHSCGSEATFGRRVSVEAAEAVVDVLEAMSSLVSVLCRLW